MKPETRLILSQARYIRDYDAAAARKFSEAAAIVRRVQQRTSERYERSRG